MILRNWFTMMLMVFGVMADHHLMSGRCTSCDHERPQRHKHKSRRLHSDTTVAERSSGNVAQPRVIEPAEAAEEVVVMNKPAKGTETSKGTQGKVATPESIKIVIIHSEHCPPCRWMVANVKPERVASKSNGLILARNVMFFEGHKDKGNFEQYLHGRGVTGYPTIIILVGNEQIHRRSGQQSEDDLIRLVRKSLEEKGYTIQK